MQDLQPEKEKLQSGLSALDDLKKKVDNMAAAGLAPLIAAGKSSTKACVGSTESGVTNIATQIEYTFNNLHPKYGDTTDRQLQDAQKDETQRRAAFRTQLNDFLGDYSGATSLAKDTDKEGNTSYSFTLTDLREETVKVIDQKINDLATVNHLDAFPLRLDCEPVEVTFTQLRNNYGTVSGVGRASKAVRNCNDTFTFSFHGVTEDGAEGWLSHELVNGGEPVRTEITTEKGPNVQSYNFTRNYVCGDYEPPKHAYILVVQTKKPFVAQYRKLNVSDGHEEQIPLKTITVGKPACPPAGVLSPANGMFKEKLEKKYGGSCQPADR